MTENFTIPQMNERDYLVFTHVPTFARTNINTCTRTHKRLLYLQLSANSTCLFLGDKLLDIESGHGQPPTQHFTVIFNSFVLMTLFNEFNARKIHGQRNVFEGVFTNPIFYSIWIGTCIAQVSVSSFPESTSTHRSLSDNYKTYLQVVIVQYGKMAFSTKELSLDQWLWCLFFGFGTLIWGQLVTTVPTRKLPKLLSYVSFSRIRLKLWEKFPNGSPD